jgi:ribosomal protein S18 acetylase RimI-like enzyme
MNYRSATSSDASLLAAMNQHLIRDEHHRNPMNLGELEQRMAGWLQGEYRAVVFEREDEPAGYALFRVEPDYVYLRQFFVKPDMRRQGIGRAAIDWLVKNVWNEIRRVRLEVLVENKSAIEFWRAIGFRDYAVTMELDKEKNGRNTN